jgi:hypothetical protein
MNSIFTTQGFLVIVLDTGIDLSLASVTKIIYKKPSGRKGEFTATVFETTKLRYQFTNADLDVSGEWQFQAYVIIGGLNAYGEIVRQSIKKPLL